MMTLRETIAALTVCSVDGNNDVRVQVDQSEDEGGPILPIQSIEIGVDGRVYIRAYKKGA